MSDFSLKDYHSQGCNHQDINHYKDSKNDCLNCLWFQAEMGCMVYEFTKRDREMIVKRYLKQQA